MFSPGVRNYRTGLFSVTRFRDALKLIRKAKLLRIIGCASGIPRIIETEHPAKRLSKIALAFPYSFDVRIHQSPTKLLLRYYPSVAPLLCVQLKASPTRPQDSVSRLTGVASPYRTKTRPILGRDRTHFTSKRQALLDDPTGRVIVKCPKGIYRRP